MNLFMNSMQYDRAIALLNGALQIDSNFLPALSNKFSFEIAKERYDTALITGIHIIRLRPSFYEMYNTVAMMYYYLGDTIASQNYFKQADIKINQTLDTIKASNVKYKELLTNKAFVLVFQDSLAASDSIISMLIRNSKDSLEKEVFKDYLHKNKQQLLCKIFQKNDSASVSYADTVSMFNIDTVHFYGKKDIHKYHFSPGFYLLKQDYSNTKGFKVAGGSESYFIARHILVPLTFVDSIFKTINRFPKGIVVNIYFSKEGTKALYDFTLKCVNEKAGLLINDSLFVAAKIYVSIESGHMAIFDANFTEKNVDSFIYTIKKVIHKDSAIQ